MRGTQGGAIMLPGRHFWLSHFGGMGTGRGVTTGSWRVRTGGLPNVHMPTPARTTKNDLENVDSVLVEKLRKIIFRTNTTLMISRHIKEATKLYHRWRTRKEAGGS